ncbi:cupin domain-containing protein [Amycolatopsis sp. NPDC049252]|uniref:AraC family transcriptional regulator n=1 Tax=Amycolatopsis sp. NPDC049252 TaxID=3363933 RepID=UPI003718B158
MDLLADALRVSGARGSVGTRLVAGGTWGLWLDSFPGAALHAVSAGTMWLDVPGERPRRLDTGDVVLLPPGTAHGLSSEPGVAMGPCDKEAAAQARSAGRVVRLGSGPVRAKLLTLHYEQDEEVSTPVFAALTAPMHVPARDNASLEGCIRLLAEELAHPQIGTTAAVNSLIDLLLVQFVRAWLGSHPAERSSSWLNAVLDPVVRDALARIHQEPGRPWTTATLAAAIRVSRATLSRRFPAALGQTPGAYLTQWRMDLAALRLRDTDEPIDTMASAVGYASPQAFSRAFRRARGLAPGEYRGALRRQRSSR